MIPSSPLSWLSPIWFPSLRSSMPFTSGTRGLPTCPGETSIKSNSYPCNLFRVTIFWRNQTITPLGIAALIAIGSTILALALLTILGRYFFALLVKNF